MIRRAFFKAAGAALACLALPFRAVADGLEDGVHVRLGALAFKIAAAEIGPDKIKIILRAEDCAFGETHARLVKLLYSQQALAGSIEHRSGGRRVWRSEFEGARVSNYSCRFDRSVKTIKHMDYTLLLSRAS